VSRWIPCRRREFIRRLRQLGFDGPFSGTRQERAALWNLIFLDGINCDLRLVPYLVLRGLASEASTALRRAFEHTGVLSHIWTDPSKVDALDDQDSQEYQRAFRREVDERKAKTLKTAGTSKRFATMKLGRVAAAEAYMMLAPVTGEPSPELQERVAGLLGQLGTGESEV
jgi:hypothetical protein